LKKKKEELKSIEQVTADDYAFEIEKVNEFFKAVENDRRQIQRSPLHNKLQKAIHVSQPTAVNPTKSGVAETRPSFRSW
jgi:hypothetical protein